MAENLQGFYQKVFATEFPIEDHMLTGLDNDIDALQEHEVLDVLAKKEREDEDELQEFSERYALTIEIELESGYGGNENCRVCGEKTHGTKYCSICREDIEERLNENRLIP